MKRVVTVQKLFVFISVLTFLIPVMHSQTLSHLWSKDFGNSDEQISYKVVTDNTGNVIIGGCFQGNVNFGGGNLSSAGGWDIFIAKLDPDGNHMWSMRFGDGSDQWATAVTVDLTGDVYLVGTFNGTVNFGGGNHTSAGNTDIFLAKFKKGGSYEWCERFGGTGEDAVYGVTVDSSDNLLITGFFEESVNFGDGNLYSAGNEDVYIAKYDSAGNHIWSDRYGDMSEQIAFAIDTDDADNIAIAGHFKERVNFGGGSINSAGSEDIFVAKFNSSGVHQWSDGFGDSAEQTASGIAFTRDGEVVVTGTFNSHVNFGGGNLNSAGGYDCYLVQLDSSGNHEWSNNYGDSDDQEAMGVNIDCFNNILMTGQFTGHVHFGGSNLMSAGDWDVYLAQFDSRGTHLWSQAFGDSSEQMSFGVTSDNSGNVLMTGSFQGNVSFGGSNLNSAGGNDVFVAKYIPPHPPTPTAGPCVHHGDMNGSGNLTAEDSQMVFLMVLGFTTPTYEEECNADCDGNGILTAGDSQMIFLSVLGLEDGCVDPIP